MTDIRIDRIGKTKFHWGKLGPLKVIVAPDDFVNGAKLAKSAGKKLEAWNRLKSTQSYKKDLAEVMGIDMTSLSYEVSSGPREVWGTYLHPDLVIQLANWCSNQYGILMTRVMREYHGREAKKLLAAREGELENSYTIIDDLRATMARMEAKMEKDGEDRVKAERKAGVKMEKMDNKLDRVNGKLDTVKSQLTSVEGRLVKAKDTRVLSTGERQYENRLLIWKLNQDEDDFAADEIPFEYAASRLTEQSMSTAMAKKLQDYPHAEIILEIDDTPSAMALWRYYKKRHGRKIEWGGCNFYLNDGYTEERMIRDLKACHRKRMTDKGLW
tara:strand:+ start:1113 stop:2093 length:981 start_codon:yes stop_codon:yes gene_type:complete